MTTHLSQGTPFGAQPNTATTSQPSNFFNASETTESDPFSFVRASPVKSGLGPSPYVDQSNASEPNTQIGGNFPLPTPAPYHSGQPPQAPPSLHGARVRPPVIFPTNSTTQSYPPPPPQLSLPTVDTQTEAANYPLHAARPSNGHPPPHPPSQRDAERPPSLSHHGRSVSVPVASTLFSGHAGDDDIFTALSSKSNVFLPTRNPQTHPLREEGLNSLSTHSGQSTARPEWPPSNSAGPRRASYTDLGSAGSKGGPPLQDQPPSQTAADGDIGGASSVQPPTEGDVLQPARVGDLGITQTPEMFGEGAGGGGDGQAYAYGIVEATPFGGTRQQLGPHATDMVDEATGGRYGSVSLPQSDQAVHSALVDSYELGWSGHEEPNLTYVASVTEEIKMARGEGAGVCEAQEPGGGDSHTSSPGKSVVSLLNNEEDFAATLSPVKLLPPTTGPPSTCDGGNEHGASAGGKQNIVPPSGSSEEEEEEEGAVPKPAQGYSNLQCGLGGGIETMATAATHHQFTTAEVRNVRAQPTGRQELFVLQPTPALCSDQQPPCEGQTEPQRFESLRGGPAVQAHHHLQPLWSQPPSQHSHQSQTQNQTVSPPVLHTAGPQSQPLHTQPTQTQPQSSGNSLGTRHVQLLQDSASSPDPLLLPPATFSRSMPDSSESGPPLSSSLSKQSSTGLVTSLGLVTSHRVPVGTAGHSNARDEPLPPSSNPQIGSYLKDGDSASHSTTASLHHQAADNHSIHDQGPPRRYPIGSELPPGDGSEFSKGYPLGPEAPRGYLSDPRPPRSYPLGPEVPKGYPLGPEAPRGYQTDPEPPRGLEPQRVSSSDPEQQRGYPSGPEQQRGYPSGPEQQRGYPPGPEQQRGYPSGPEQQRGYPPGPEQQRGYPPGPEQQRGYPPGPEQQRGYPPGPEQQRGYPPGPEQQRGYPPGPEQQRGYPTGPEQQRGYLSGPEPPRVASVGPEPSRGYGTVPEQQRGHPTGPEQPPRDDHNPHRNSRHTPMSSSQEHYHHRDAYGDQYGTYPSHGPSHYPPYQEVDDYYRQRGPRHPLEDWGWGGYSHPSRYYAPSDWYYSDYGTGYGDPYQRSYAGYDPYGAYYGTPYDYDPRYLDHHGMVAYDGGGYEGAGAENPAQQPPGEVKSQGSAHEASSIYTYGNQGNFEESKLDASVSVPQMQQQTSSHFDMSNYAGNESGSMNYHGNTQYEETGEGITSREPSCERQLSATPPPPGRETPVIFYNPHVTARFGIGGQLVVVLPDAPYMGQQGVVEILSLHDLLGEEEEEKEEEGGAEPFVPGETPKSSVVRYAQLEAEKCHDAARNAADEVGKRLAEDEALMWDFLVLLCQQNGVLVPSDVADLLLSDEGAYHTKLYSQSKHLGGGGGGGGGTTNLEDSLDEFRRRLLAGRRKDALELACARCLWGHALMLSSGMDDQSRTYVVNRFTASLVTADPLSTFYTLLLGRTPSSVKPEGLQRAGNWRPHLAMILTNQNSKAECGAIVSLGDALLSQDRVSAAHLCYLLARVHLGAYGDGGAKYSLLGTRQVQLVAGECPSLSQLRMTEVYEYAMTLGKPDFALPGFQMYKYLRMLKLVQRGLSHVALIYCESIARAVVRCSQDCRQALLLGLVEFSARLYYATSSAGLVEQELPSWITQLQQVVATLSTEGPTLTSSANQLYHGPVPILGQESLPEHNPHPILGLGQYRSADDHSREGSTRASSRAEQQQLPQQHAPGRAADGQPPVEQSGEEMWQLSTRPVSREVEAEGSRPTITSITPPQGRQTLPAQSFDEQGASTELTMLNPLYPQAPGFNNPEPSGSHLDSSSSIGGGQSHDSTAGFQSFSYQPPVGHFDESAQLSYQPPEGHADASAQLSYQPPVGHSDASAQLSYQISEGHAEQVAPMTQQTPFVGLSYSQDQGPPSNRMTTQSQGEMAGGRGMVGGHIETLRQGKGSHDQETRSLDVTSATTVPSSSRRSPQPKDGKADSKLGRYWWYPHML